MTDKRLCLVLVLAFAIACKPSTQPVKKTAAAAGPQTRATVVTIRTTIQPANQTSTHLLVIAGNVARSTGELDSWRLFDLKNGTVTYVDDIAKTARTETLASIVSKRQAVLTQALPAHIPRVTWESSGQKRAILGVTAEQSVMRAGAYRRDLWIAKHPAIPEQLFAMMQASDPPSSPLAPMARAADEALASMKGFPLLERAEVPYGNSKFVTERAVLGIGQKDVPKALLEVPRGYRDLTPKAPPR